MKATKIEAGRYTYRGHSVTKSDDYGYTEWNVHVTGGRYVGACETKREAIALVDATLNTTRLTLEACGVDLPDYDPNAGNWDDYTAAYYKADCAADGETVEQDHRYR